MDNKVSDIFNAADYGFISGKKLDGCDLAVVKKNDEFGIFDINEKKIIFDNIMDVDIENFSEGMLPIKDRGANWRYFNVLDKIITPYGYGEVSPFKKGYAFVHKRNHGIKYAGEGIINKKGYEIIPSSYYLIGKCEDDFIVGQDDNGLYYLFDKNWHQIPFPGAWRRSDRVIKYNDRNEFEVCHKYADLYRKDRFIVGYDSRYREYILNYSAIYTFYPIEIDGFILVKKMDSKFEKEYFLICFNGQCISIDDLCVEDNIKVKKIIKEKYNA